MKKRRKPLSSKKSKKRIKLPDIIKARRELIGTLEKLTEKDKMTAYLTNLWIDIVLALRANEADKSTTTSDDPEKNGNIDIPKIKHNVIIANSKRPDQVRYIIPEHLNSKASDKV